MRRSCFVLKRLCIWQHRFSTSLSMFLVCQNFHRTVGFISNVDLWFHKVVRLRSFSAAKVLYDFIQAFGSVLFLCKVIFSLYREFVWQVSYRVVTFLVVNKSRKSLLWVKSCQEEFVVRYQSKRLAFGECVQHSVQRAPDGWTLRVFRHFAWLEVGSVKMAWSRPAHQRVTHIVRPPTA
jgi:hypothetical protein